MIESKLDAEHSILYLYPKHAIAKEDFFNISAEIDPYIDANGLHGIIVEAEGFPGWESFGAMAEHLRFVKEHQRSVQRIAIVTNSKLGNIVECLAKHFVAAKVKHFPAGETDKAKQWVMSVL